MLRPVIVAAITALLIHVGPVAGQDVPAVVPPAAIELYPPLTAGPPATPPVPTGVPERYESEPLPAPPQAPGQQHWVALNTSVFQPMVARVQVKVWPRPNNSVWLEAYGGSVLFDGMYGFGARLMHTHRVGRRGDVMMLSPGLGMHVLPHWYVAGEYDRHGSFGGWGGSRYNGYYNSLYYLAADVDLSWLHDFGDHFGFELGVKLGLAGRVGGTVGRDYPSGLMFGRDFYPLFNIYSGLRF